MNFIESIIHSLKKYARFEGRSTVLEFWYFHLFYYSLWFIPILINKIVFDNSEKINFFSLFPIISALILLPPYISVTVRRLHDINKNGWWYFIHMIPLIGILIIYIICSLPGTKGINKYGCLEIK
ncbi:DUF805 domain-containing protein [Silvanigrella paludirubra]|uniref:DUF805 domain-containing protein n=1 Tax=Silvanigrella paludirubra TaxID=2499159 RepID=A0A6N6VUH9_9BACT|nr:DUF805 domain-containing protein [Silvanigrella paludirubra]KAB8036542.1 DUF805 domain-containing protein [Silvanigrella paludirubra]